MKMAIDIKKTEFVHADVTTDGEFICPECGTYLSRKTSPGGRGGYFTHSRGVATGCTHKDKDLYETLLDGNTPSVLRTTTGYARHIARLRRKLEKIQEALRQHERQASNPEAA